MGSQQTIFLFDFLTFQLFENYFRFTFGKYFFMAKLLDIIIVITIIANYLIKIDSLSLKIAYVNPLRQQFKDPLLIEEKINLN